MTADYTVTTMALRLRVTEEAVRRWIRAGRLFAEKRGNRFRIPIADAALFIEAYEATRRRGRPLEVTPPLNERHAPFRVQRGGSRATMDQNLSLVVRPSILVWMDEQRAAFDKPISRSAFLRDILEREKKRSDLHKQKLERDERRHQRMLRKMGGGG